MCATMFSLCLFRWCSSVSSSWSLDESSCNHKMHPSIHVRTADHWIATRPNATDLLSYHVPNVHICCLHRLISCFPALPHYLILKTCQSTTGMPPQTPAKTKPTYPIPSVILALRFVSRSIWLIIATLSDRALRCLSDCFIINPLESGGD